MSDVPLSLVCRISQFSARTRHTIRESLGEGKDGVVFTTTTNNAVKFVREVSVYRRERDAYLRLREKHVSNIGVFNIPKLVAFDDTSLAIEMTVVEAPFILDFASAHPDVEPDFNEDVLADHRARIEDFFGERAPDVFALLSELAERHGVYMLDARPANIQF